MYFPDRGYVRPLRHSYGYATVRFYKPGANWCGMDGTVLCIGGNASWVAVRAFTLGGPACSRCSGGTAFCTQHGLCNDNCSEAGAPDCQCEARCDNCPKLLDLAVCRCFCADGWHGTDCSQSCQDQHHYCNTTWTHPLWSDRSTWLLTAGARLIPRWGREGATGPSKS